MQREGLLKEHLGLYAIWVLACFDKIMTGDKLCGTLSLFRDWDW